MGIFVVIWYIFPVLVCRTKKNLATLVSGGRPKTRVSMYVANLSGRERKKNLLLNRVARWYIFKPKVSIWVIFCGP
jgi:hypothetical protein